MRNKTNSNNQNIQRDKHINLSPFPGLRFPFTHHSSLITILFLFSFILLLLSCGANDPIIEDNTKPGRRDYEWTLDTLYSPNNWLNSIWGASPKSIWLAGGGGITNYDRLWYFNGDTWAPYTQQQVKMSPDCIFGFSEDEIWLGGNDAKIWKWDGSIWSEEYRRYDNSNIIDIAGNNSDFLYAIGSDYILCRIENTWVDEIKFKHNADFLRILIQNDIIYLSGLNPASDTLKFWQYKNKKIYEIYSDARDNVIWASMNKIGEEIYFLIGRDLNRYREGKFIKIKTFSEQNFGYQVYGRNMKDLFIRMRDGVAHYDGTNIVYLYQFSNLYTSFFDPPLIFENDVFFAVSDDFNGHNIVLHGRQKTLGQK